MTNKKARSAIKDVISREYTINLHKVPNHRSASADCKHWKRNAENDNKYRVIPCLLSAAHVPPISFVDEILVNVAFNINLYKTLHRLQFCDQKMF